MISRYFLGAGLLALLLASGCSSRANPPVDTPEPTPDPLLRTTAQGDIRGSVDGANNMLAFRGIPYAEPPLGDLRFAPPQPAAAHTGVLQASDFGPNCAQAGGVMGGASDSEDCLYLNVYTPEESENLPVMVWIHGGAFISGSGGEEYTPARLVAEDMVVVTLNYRLGALGFLAHPTLTAEQSGSSGAYGLLDQKLALEWVQANIAEFGGNPNNVTIFGESAGGHSVLSLVASPLTAGLFHKVIVQSGAYLPTQISLDIAEQLGSATFDECADTACLRALSVEEILARQQGLTDGTGVNPNYGSEILPQHSIESALSSGNYQPVPVLMGTNLDEYTLFVGIDALSGVTPPTAEDYHAEIGALIGQPAESPAVVGIASFYPLDLYGGNVWQAMGAIGTDAVFACNALRQATQLSPMAATYVYEFADREAPLTILPLRPEGLELGASHAFEIPYIWGSEAAFREIGATDEQVELSQRMIRYWTRFARNGDPNGDSGAHWPAFDVGAQFMQLGGSEVLTPATDFATYHRCPIWDPAQ
ncbi:carboxylesterase/lipase family protein [Microbulbifer hydrolyticus]|uniref:Carboxylic ester hydrolase n=1 Tax=Microbulbifer hydrolyticus TaxID=48074 RepID=A0A6P1T8I3_9GAMM|nr:carboxylesterase family protein [Microbulbifer hydrolyticus]MBB5211194.1 para-nitrobenzyl esterase [Microbulbifer hydrolyticus]QHQ38035.1 carboxylesterase family protein [Microbulbifer hydrolyticus]